MLCRLRRSLRRALFLGCALASPVFFFRSISAGEFWAFKPLARPEPPRIVDPAGLSGPAAPIDAFLLEALGRKGLGIAGEADRRTHVRRVTLDLTGLPPSPDEVDAYLADSEPGAYERLVERLLASPHFAEHWAQIWLDAAGYSDSNGYH